MYIQEGKYYHIYNRSNNHEIVFKEEENYSYFLSKYHRHCDPCLETISYCLMPSHFHFLVCGITGDSVRVQRAIAAWLSGYTRAINKRFNRHGNLFQQHSKAKEITDQSYLVALVAYIHQNPVRSGLVKHLEDWPHSSYHHLVRMGGDDWKRSTILESFFPTPNEFAEFSNMRAENVRREFWT